MFEEECKFFQSVMKFPDKFKREMPLVVLVACPEYLAEKRSNKNYLRVFIKKLCYTLKIR